MRRYYCLPVFLGIAIIWFQNPLLAKGIYPFLGQPDALQPTITLSPDTLDGGGTVSVEVSFGNTEIDFEYAYFYIYHENGERKHSQAFHYFDLYAGAFSSEFEITAYDRTGQYFVKEMGIVYRNNTQKYYAEDFNESIFVKNTVHDSCPPIINNYDISPKLALPGDTVFIEFEIEDTLSGLHYSVFDVVDEEGNNYMNDFHFFTGKQETLVFKYVVDKFEKEGLRFFEIKINDHYNNSILYNNSNMDFKFYVAGTITDEQSPILKNLAITNNPGNKELFLDLTITDNVSGIKKFYGNLIGLINYYINIKDFTKVNDSLYRANLLGLYPYLATGTYKLDFYVIDSAGNRTSYNTFSKEIKIVNSQSDPYPPVISGAKVTNNAENGEIILELDIKEEESGLDGLICVFDGELGYEFHSYDFEKAGNSIYQCNLLEKYPYITSGNYSLELFLSDSADNHSYFYNYGDLQVNNPDSDNQPPQIVSMKFDKDTVYPGENITLEIEVEDDKSGIYFIQGRITNKENQDEYFRFDKEIVEYGKTSYTYSKTIELPEFNMGGLWKANRQFVEDHAGGAGRAGYSSNSYPTPPSFYNIPRYIDTIPPKIKSLAYFPNIVNAGDTVVATIIASDDFSGISNIMCHDNYIRLETQERVWEKTGLDTYQCTIPINKHAIAQTINYDFHGIMDAAGNHASPDALGKAFTIVNNGMADREPPVFDSLCFLNHTLNKDDTLQILLYARDGLSGILSNSVGLLFYKMDGLEQLENPNLHELSRLKLKPTNLGNNFFEFKIPAKNLMPGDYELRSIYMNDSATNSYSNYLSGSVRKTYLGYNFTVTGEYGFDNERPSLIEAIASLKTAKPGDTVQITLKVLEKESGILSIKSSIWNPGSAFVHYFKNEDWEITEISDTFYCKTNFIVPESAFNGKWIINQLYIHDYYLNLFYYSYYEDEFSQNLLEIEVNGGQQLPNRPPTWAVKSINLELGPNGTLQYHIPEILVSDIDGDSLQFSAQMGDGGSLESWIGFSPNNLGIALNPDSTISGDYIVRIVAADPRGAEDSLMVNIAINPGSITNISAASKNGLFVYPIPAKNTLNIHHSNNNGNEIGYIISSLTGNVVLRGKLTGNKMDIQNLGKGIYMLGLEIDGELFYQKIVVE